MEANGGRRGPYKKNRISELLETSGWVPTQEIVRELFHYDENEGTLIRKINRSGIKGRAGQTAGTLNLDSGYVMVRVGRRSLPAHRVIFLWHHGYYPENEVDHINRDRLDNRIENLREATSQCQARNRGQRSDNTSGVKGISFCRRSNKWLATICATKGKKRFLGYYKDFIEAVCHRYAAEQCLDWSFCDTDSIAYKYLVSVGAVKGKLKEKGYV